MVSKRYDSSEESSASIFANSASRMSASIGESSNSYFLLILSTLLTVTLFNGEESLVNMFYTVELNIWDWAALAAIGKGRACYSFSVSSEGPFVS